MHLSAAQQVFLLDLSRTTIHATLRSQSPPDLPPATDPLFLSPAGCFVSLHESHTHRLRGCVGRIHSDLPLLQTLRDAAVSVLHDPRFEDFRLTLDDLPGLTIELSILSPLTQAAHPLDFDPLTDGIYLFCCGRSGTFLPQVARQTGWTREQLLARLCTEKMGLPPTSWKNPETTKLLTYRTVVIGPTPFLPTPPSSPVFSTETAPRPTVGFGADNVFRI